LEDLCRVLSSVNHDIGQLAGVVQARVSALHRAAASAAQVRDDEGRPDASSRAAAALLENAARELASAAALLGQASRQGESFIARTVGGGAGGGSVLGEVSRATTATALGSTAGGPDAGGAAAADPPSTNELGPYGAFGGRIPLSLGAIVGGRAAQGQLGDCGVIAAVDAVRLKDPALLARNCRANAEGTYTVRLHVGGQPRDVTVAASAPRRSARSYAAGEVVASPSVVTLYEKAVATLVGQGYGGLAGFPSDRALSLVTGRAYQRVGQADLGTIRTALSTGPVTVVSGSVPSQPLVLGVVDWTPAVVPQHAYAVAEVVERPDASTGQPVLVIHLINPWGRRGQDQTNGPMRASELWLTQEQFQQSFPTTCMPVT